MSEPVSGGAGATMEEPPGALPAAGRAARGVAGVAAAVLAGVALAVLVAAGWLEIAAALTIVPALLLAAAGRPLLGLATWLALMPVVARGPAEAYWLAHRLIPLTALAGAAAWFVLERRRLDRHARWLIVLSGTFGVLALVHVLLLSNDPTTHLVRLVDLLFVPMALMVVLLLAAPGARRDWLVISAAGVLALGVQLTTLALGWLAPQVLPRVWTLKTSERGTGTLVDPAPFTAFVVAVAAIVAIGVLRSRLRLPLRPILAALAGVAVLAAVLSFSRGSWLAGAIAALLAVARAPGRLARAAAAIVVLAAFLALGPLSGLTEAFATRLGEQGQVTGRVDSVQAQLDQIARAPLFGQGYGNLRDQRLADDAAGLRPVGSHNTYLGLAADFGLPLAALYLGPVGLLAWRDRRLLVARPSASRSVLARRLLWLALVFQVVVSMFVDMAQSQAVATGVWWLTIGLIAIHGRPTTER